MTAALIAKLRAARSDQLLANSALIFLTTVLMAGGGALFWVIAARLATPEDVGLAGSLVAAADSLALFAQLGLNIAILRTMPTSGRKARRRAHRLRRGARRRHRVRTRLLPAAAGHLAEADHRARLAVGRSRSTACWSAPPRSTCSPTACSWPSTGSRTTCASTGSCSASRSAGCRSCSPAPVRWGSTARSVGRSRCCAVASLWVIFRHVPGRRSLSPSRELLDARRFAGAGYVTYVLTVLPLLVFPILVINALGSAARRVVLHQLPDRHPAQRGHPRGRQRDVRRERARHRAAASTSSARAA